MSSDPLPGAYTGIDILDYHRGPGVSKSQLDLIARSPAHFQYEQRNPRKDTKAFKIGRLTHMAVLEPELYSETVAVMPDCDRRTKAGKEAYAAFCDENEGKEIITEAEHIQLRGMQATVSLHPAANLLLSGEGPTRELSVYWDKPVPRTGLRLTEDEEPEGGETVFCRCRPDLLIPPGSVGNQQGGVIVDLKTTRDASPRAFMSSCRKFRYHVQAAWYLEGCNRGFAHEEMFETFIFIAVEKEPPYGVAVYTLGHEDIREGHLLAEHDLAVYAKCQKSGTWPSYSPQIQTIEL